MTIISSNILSILTLCALAACDARTSQPADKTPSLPSQPTPLHSASNWLGVWLGPEGTSLEIIATGSGYRIIVKNLDGPRTFSGVEATSNRLNFERDGVTESIRRGNGTETGMKWLADKSNCLVVKAGEGYCRG